MPPAQHAPHRLLELDSLRGLAALVVFSSHTLLLLPAQPAALLPLYRTPFVLFLLGGHQAVILFFLLSGFVLYLPYTRPGYLPQPYLPFAAKRLCRIYLPYLAAILATIALYLVTFVPLGPPADVSVFYSWRALSPHAFFTLFLQHIVFVGSFHREYWNSSTWSLAEELRISLVFPILAALVTRLRWPATLGLALLTSTAASLGIARLHHRFPLATLHYATIFLIGALLAAHHPRLTQLWQRAGRPLQLLAIALCLYLCANPYYLSPYTPLLHPEEAADWLIALTCAVFLIASISHTWFSRLLRHRLPEHLGRISYSFYLLHLPLILALTTLLRSRLPYPLIIALALLLTLLSAHLFFRFVERPAIALGKHLTRRVQ